MVYIFQSAPADCIPFSDSLLDPPYAIFHFLSSILLLFTVLIISFAGKIMGMVGPYLDPPNIFAVTTLPAIAF
jgi:hypothetical protein